MDHTRKVKKTCLGLYKVLKNRISRDDPALVKAKKELIEVAEEVIAGGQKVRVQLNTSEKPSLVGRLVKQLEGGLEDTEKVVEQTKATLSSRLHLKRRLDITPFV